MIEVRPRDKAVLSIILGVVGALCLVEGATAEESSKRWTGFGLGAVLLSFALPVPLTGRRLLPLLRFLLTLFAAVAYGRAVMVEERTWRVVLDAVVAVLLFLSAWGFGRGLVSRGPASGGGTVSLTEVRTSKVAAIRALREVLPQLSLAEAKGIVDEAAAGKSALIPPGASPEQADAINKVIEAIGGRVETRKNP